MHLRSFRGIVLASVLVMLLSVIGCSRGSHVHGQTPRPPLASASSTSQVFGGHLSGEVISDEDWQAAVAGAKANTALVHNAGCGFSATGSAAAIGPSRLLTNRHVVEDARKMSVVTTSGEKAEVKSWTYSKEDDLAVLQLSEPLFADPLTVASAPVVPGDLVVVMGFPLGGPFTTGRGRISGVSDDFDEPMLEATVDILPGNSGGPLVSTKGQIAGLIRAIDLQADQALAIPPDRLKKAIDGVDMTQGLPCR